MNKRLCTFLTLLLVLTFVCGFVPTARAADATVTFRGYADGFSFAPGSAYTDSDLFDNFKDVMPGDSRTQNVTISNAATDCDYAEIFLRAVPHDDEADGRVSDREFLEQLSMQVYYGADKIYDASPDQTDGLTDDISLGIFRRGDEKTLRVELSVPIALSNEAAARIGEVDWVFHAECYNEDQLTVRKVWSDGNAYHRDDVVTVALLRDGEIVKTQELSEDNQWTYTFDRLREGYVWTVEEQEVPENYDVSYETNGNVVTIVNTRRGGPPIIDADGDLTVEKLWRGARKTPASVTVTLFNGTEAVETVTLNESNNWRHEWKNLDRKGNWQVMETNIPKGFTPSYVSGGGTVVITNTASLIQTGLSYAPLAALLVGGAALIAAGCILIFRKKRRA